MSEPKANERLASLEAKMEIFLKLLQEIRDDIKNQPSKNEFVKLAENFESLKDDIHDELRSFQQDYDKKLSNLDIEYTGKISEIDKGQKNLNFKVGTAIGATSLITSLLSAIVSHYMKNP